MNKDDSSTFDKLLDALMASGGEHSYRLRMVKGFNDMPTPRGIDESAMAADMYTDFTAHSIAHEMLHHISNHGGEDCVADLIKCRVTTLYADILETIEDGCIHCDLVNPLRGASVNEQTVADILAEASDD